MFFLGGFFEGVLNTVSFLILVTFVGEGTIRPFRLEFLDRVNTMIKTEEAAK